MSFGDSRLFYSYSSNSYLNSLVLLSFGVYIFSHKCREVF